MNYLLDTVVVIRHFSDNPNIGKTAKIILENVTDENLFYISIISLMEILYLSEKNRIPLKLRDAFNNINISSLYTIVDFKPEILKVMELISFYELHDRAILATAKWLDVPILSSDKEFQKLRDIQVIWD